MPSDLDQSGSSWQKVRAWLGPSLGWGEVQVRPTRTISAGGTFSIVGGDQVILVNVAATVNVQLPDVRLWVQETANQPATGFERSIWVKDLGGNAASFNITITPFGTQKIDLQSSFVMNAARQFVRLYPLNDLTGWYVG